MASKKQSSVLGQCSVNDTYMPTIQQGGTHNRSPTAFQMPLNNMPNRTPIDPDVIFYRALEASIKEMKIFNDFGVIWHSSESMTRIRVSLNGINIVFSLKDKDKKSTDIADELIDLGLNCGGFVIAAFGVKASLVVAPVTGGSSLLATGWAVTQAATSLIQCGASVYRTYNVLEGKKENIEANESLDNNPYYKNYTKGMLFLDAVDMAGVAKGAVKGAGKIMKSRLKAEKNMLKNLNNGYIPEQKSKKLLKLAEKKGGVDAKDIAEIRKLPKSKKIKALQDLLETHRHLLRPSIMKAIKDSIKYRELSGNLFSVTSSASGGVVGEMISIVREDRAELHLEVIDLSPD